MPCRWIGTKCKNDRPNKVSCPDLLAFCSQAPSLLANAAGHKVRERRFLRGNRELAGSSLVQQQKTCSRVDSLSEDDAEAGIMADASRLEA